MVCLATTLIPNQIELETPHATGISAPTISASVDLLDAFLSALNNPLVVSFVRRIVNNNLSKCFTGVPITGFSDDYFDQIYVLPTSIDAGIILAQVQVAVTVHSSFRSGTVQWTGYDDSAAGAGVSLGTPAPPPPTINILPLSSSAHTLTIALAGPPTISANIVFDFLNPASAAVQILMPIAGQRSVLFPYQPESPIKEVLDWVTYVKTSSNSEEQRSSGRPVPRSTLRLRLRTTGADTRTLENKLFDGQARAFGVPVWFQSTKLTSAVSIGATVINVVDTTFLGLVVGNTAIVWSSSTSFESLEVASFTSTTITFSSAFLAAFPVDALVMPVLVATMVTPAGSSRFRVNISDFNIAFAVVDNGVSLADTSAFSSYTPTGGVQRVLLDDDNFVDSETITERLQRELDVVDVKTSFPDVFTDQDVSRETSQKGFFTNSPVALSNVRKLLHALAGKRVSFYLPTSKKDLDPLASVASADQAVTVVDADYVNLVNQRQPRNVIRIVPKSGAASTPKLVTGSSKPAAGQETISIAPDTAGVTIALADIDRIEYVKKSRFDTDRIEINHFNSNGKAAIYIPVVTVLEGDL